LRRETPDSGTAGAAVDVRLYDGLPDAIDGAAGNADDRHHFLRRAWFEANAAAAASTLVGTRADGRVVAALPLVAAGPAMLGVRAVPGSYWPFRSFPVAADIDDAELAAFLAAPEARRALGRAWRLGPVHEDDPTAVRLLRVARRSGWSVLKRRVGTEFVLDIAEERKSGPWPRPSTVRNNHKHDKRLARLGTLEWRFVSGSDWSEAVFDELSRIERNSWVGSRSGADSKFIDPVRRAGWEKIASDPVIAAMLGTGILSIGGEPAAFSFGINSGRTRYCVATSYDQRFAKHSPGTVTGYRTYVESAERGFDRLNLGMGDGGEKSGMGARPGPAVLDCLFVRNRALAAVLRPLWRSRGAPRSR
jgi:CelD/BcsL family acetyltransferase involved in cellulose biosynthesis